MFTIIKELYNKNSINLYGEKGTGKTTILEHIGFCVHRRNLFKDGVYYFDLKELKNQQFDLKILMQNDID